MVIGIAQEQHSERCRLFAQWHKLDWPILHDPINLMGVRGVPIDVAIDEHGIVHSLRADLKTLEKEFLDKTLASDDATTPAEPQKATRPDLANVRRRAEGSNSADAWRELGDAVVLWEGPAKINDGINAYTQAINANPNDGASHFRLGVCYRMRNESSQRKPGDFRTAVEHWTKARAINPNQYIWRRRVEQYGPRLNKPYPFYDWMEAATRDIRERGEQPIELRVLPTTSELAGPTRTFQTEPQEVTSPDPNGRVARDTDGLILIETAVVPPHVGPGGSARVHVTLRPNEKLEAHWNNEAEPVRLWVDPPPGWQTQPRLSVASQSDETESSKPRRFEFEIRAPDNSIGPSKLAGYVLYYVCEDKGGTCRFLRQDIPIKVTVED